MSLDIATKSLCMFQHCTIAVFSSHLLSSVDGHTALPGQITCYMVTHFCPLT